MSAIKRVYIYAPLYFSLFHHFSTFRVTFRGQNAKKNAEKYFSQILWPRFLWKKLIIFWSKDLRFWDMSAILDLAENGLSEVEIFRTFFVGFSWSTLTDERKKLSVTICSTSKLNLLHYDWAVRFNWSDLLYVLEKKLIKKNKYTSPSTQNISFRGRIWL